MVFKYQIKKFINLQNILLVAIIVLVIFLRFYQLGDVPSGLTNDEANTGYDAYSILLTAKDQWGTFLPISNFKGFGDYPPPIYRYISTIPIALFGLSEFSVRFASAIFGVFSVAAVYFLIKKFFDKNSAICASLFFAILPWGIGLSRVALESNVAIFFIVSALFFGLKPKTTKYLYLSVIFLGVSMYTYSAYILFAPLVLFIILAFNYKEKVKFSSLAKPFIVFVVIVAFLFVQRNAASVRFSQVGILTNVNSVGLINTLNDQRGQCLKSVNPFVCKILENKASVFAGSFTKNYLSHFSSNFLYINGTVTQYSILPQRGLDYLFGSILLVIGILFVIKVEKHRKIGITLILLFLLSALPDSFTGDGNFSRGSLMQPFIAIFDGLGFSYLLFSISFSKYKYLRYLFYVLFSFFIVFSVTSFYINYLTYFKNNYSLYSQYGYKDLTVELNGQKQNYDRIYVSRHLNDTKQYIYFLFYTKYDPLKFQSKLNVEYSQGSDGWISINRLDNIYFVQNPPAVKEMETYKDKNVLVVSNPVDFPKKITPVFLIKDKLGNVIFKAEKASDLLEYNREQELLKLKNGSI